MIHYVLTISGVINAVDITHKTIIKLWPETIANVRWNTKILAAEMCSKSHITLEQEEHILREEKPHDQAAQLVICVLENQRSNEFLCSMKEIPALKNTIVKKIEEQKKIFGE